MIVRSHRVLWSGLVLMPTAALLMLPDRLVLSTLEQVGAATVLIALIAAVVGTVLLSRRPGPRQPQAANTAPLLNPAAMRAMRGGLPPESVIREELGQLLVSAPPRMLFHDRPEPESGDHALRLVIERILRAWGDESLDEVATSRLHELWLLKQLAQASPDRAGALAQQFLNPGAALAIHDHVASVTRYRHAFDTQLATFDATRRLWHTPRKPSLLDALQSLEQPDADLWHKVIREHDPADPAQRDAALWCARQPGCDRASVALFLSGLAQSDRLEAAARAGDGPWLAGVRDVIEGWNAGRYPTQEIALNPALRLSNLAPAFADRLDRLAAITHEPRWPAPRGAFAEYTGREARRRDHWNLVTGRLCTAPLIADYLDPGDRSAA